MRGVSICMGSPSGATRMTRNIEPGSIPNESSFCRYAGLISGVKPTILYECRGSNWIIAFYFLLTQVKKASGLLEKEKRILL